MQTYAEFRPTEYDTAGLLLGDQQDWLVLPVTRNRDSGALDNSNFEFALEALGGEGGDVEVHCFGHWCCGWFEVILVRPGTPAAEEAHTLEARLAIYPALDEEDFSRREYEAYQESWGSWGASDFVVELVKRLGLTEGQEDALEAAPANRLQTFFEDLNPCGDYYDESGPRIRRSAETATLDDVTEFLASL